MDRSNGGGSRFEETRPNPIYTRLDFFFHERDMRERTDIERDKETAVRFFNVGWNLSPLWLRVPVLV